MSSMNQIRRAIRSDTELLAFAARLAAAFDEAEPESLQQAIRNGDSLLIAEQLRMTSDEFDALVRYFEEAAQRYADEFPDFVSPTPR